MSQLPLPFQASSRTARRLRKLVKQHGLAHAADVELQSWHGGGSQEDPLEQRLQRNLIVLHEEAELRRFIEQRLRLAQRRR